MCAVLLSRVWESEQMHYIFACGSVDMRIVVKCTLQAQILQVCLPLYVLFYLWDGNYEVRRFVPCHSQKAVLIAMCP